MVISGIEVFGLHTHSRTHALTESCIEAGMLTKKKTTKGVMSQKINGTSTDMTTSKYEDKRKKENVPKMERTMKGPSLGVLLHLSEGQLSKDPIFQGTLVQEDCCPRRHWSKETFVQGASLKH